MNILIILVVTIFIVTAVYIGYHASQQATDKAETHSVPIELENTSSQNTLALQNSELGKLTHDKLTWLVSNY